MAIPATGTLRISGCTQKCGSIWKAVISGSTLPHTLSELAADACKTLPVTMTNFYNYAGPATYHLVGFSNISSTGTNGTAARCTLNCICSNVASIASQCYCITLCHNLCSNPNVAGFADVCVCCNGSCLYGCRVIGGSTASFSCAFTVIGGQSLCYWMCANHPPTGGIASCSQTCITSVANTSPAYGLFCKTTGCSICCVYTC